MAANLNRTSHWLRGLPQILFHALSVACAVACLAALAFSVILFASPVRPAAAIHEVYHWSRNSVTLMFACLVMGPVLMAVSYLIARARPKALVRTDDKWCRSLGVITGATFIWMFVNVLPLPEAITRVEGGWRTTGRFSRHQSVSEAEAKELLWQTIRFYTGSMALGLVFCAFLTKLLGDATRVTTSDAATRPDATLD